MDTRKALLEQLNDAEKKIAFMQAQIDMLMMEYCPDEMTETQIEEWAKHQVKVKGPKLD